MNLVINRNKSDDKLIAGIFKDSFVIMLIMVLVGSVAAGIDSAVAGNFLTVEAVSAIGIVYPFTKLLECISKIFSSGVQIVCSGQLGKGRMDEVNKTFSSVAIIVLMVSIIITVVVIALKTPLSILFGARVEAETLSFTENYLFAYALGTPGCLFTMFLIPMLQMDGDRARVNTASIVMMVTNVIVSAATVAFFGCGIEGIGYGTAVSYYASAIVLLTHFASKKCRLKFKLRETNFKYTWKVISMGSVAAAKLFVSAINNIVINNLVASFCDVNAMAAFAIFKATKHFFVCFDDASADAVRLITGMLRAENDKRGLRQLFKSAYKIALTGSIIISVLLFIFARPFFSLFISGAALETLVVLMRIFVISIIVDVAGFFYLSYFQCLNKKSYVLILILCMNGISMLAAWAFGALWGDVGIWWSIAFSDTLCAVVAFVLVFINNKRISLNIDSLMMIPKDSGEDIFDVELDMALVSEIDVHNSAAPKTCECKNFNEGYDREFSDGESHCTSNRTENAQNITGSKKKKTTAPYEENEINLDVFCQLMNGVEQFCSSKIVEKSVANRSCLLVEEIISNILKYGFKTKKNSFDLKIAVDETHVTIRIRDNCEAFNPIRALPVLTGELECNGLKVVFGLADRFDYVNAFGLNCANLRVLQSHAVTGSTGE